MITDELDKVEIPDLFTKGSPRIKVFQDLTMTDFNPFLFRLIPRSDFLSNKDAFFLLLNNVIGPSIMHTSMAFRSSDYLYGGLSILFAALFTLHGNRLWVRCMHEVNYRTRMSTVGYEDVLILTFGYSTGCITFLYKYIRLFIHIFVIGVNGYFGGHYLAVAKRLLNGVLLDEKEDNADDDDDGGGGDGGGDENVMIYFVIPLIFISIIVLMSLIPSWKIVAMICGICVCLRTSFYIAVFIFAALQPQGKEEKTKPGEELTFSKNDIYYRNTYFVVLMTSALQTIGLLPMIENNMKNPHHLVGKRWLIGLNDVAIVGSALLHGACGYFGYSRYMAGKTCYYIFDSIPKKLWLRTVAETVIAVSLIGSVSAPIYIIYDIVSGYFYHYFLDSPIIAAIVMKLIISAAMLLTIFGVSDSTDTKYEAMTTYFIGLFCIALPAVLDNVLYWKNRKTIPYLRKPYNLATKYVPIKKRVSRGVYLLRLLKNCVLVFAGVLLLVVNTIFMTTYEKEGRYDAKCRMTSRLFNITEYGTTTAGSAGGGGEATTTAASG